MDDQQKEKIFTLHLVYIWILKITFIPSAPFRISALNETALLVSFDNTIDEAINEKLIALHEALTREHFPGFWESVPAYSSLAVFYDPAAIKEHHTFITSVFDHVKGQVENRIKDIDQKTLRRKNVPVTVPVLYNGADLEEVAGLHKISVKELIRIHTGKQYRVFMIGFQPGFAYMGKLDERIVTARKTSPRTQVPAGSVGIAGSQTGIYPFSSPGGWQLLGQTPLKIFDKERAQHCLFKAGDQVEFISISKEEFKELNEY